MSESRGRVVRDQTERGSWSVRRLRMESHSHASIVSLHVETALPLIGCAANLVLQDGVKSADGKAVLAFAFSAVFAAVRCTAG